MARAKITAEMIAAAQRDDRQAADQIVRAMEGAVKAVALWFLGHYRDSSLDMDDLIQEGHMAVLRTIRGWDPTRGQAKFETYAYEGVLNACSKYAQKERRRGRVEVRQTDAEAHREPGRAIEWEEIPERHNRRLSLEAVSAIDKGGAEVVVRRLGPVAEGANPRRWKLVARDMGITVEEAQQLYQEAMAAIRAAHGED